MRLDRPDDYKTFKAAIERNLLAQFARHFPTLALAPLLVARELSTPLSVGQFARPHQIPGLLLTGQDVVSPGVTRAMMGGALAAASLQPRIFRHPTPSSG